MDKRKRSNVLTPFVLDENHLQNKKKHKVWTWEELVVCEVWCCKSSQVGECKEVGEELLGISGMNYAPYVIRYLFSLYEWNGIIYEKMQMQRLSELFTVNVNAFFLMRKTT